MVQKYRQGWDSRGGGPPVCRGAHAPINLVVHRHVGRTPDDSESLPKTHDVPRVDGEGEKACAAKLGLQFY